MRIIVFDLESMRHCDSELTKYHNSHRVSIVEQYSSCDPAETVRGCHEGRHIRDSSLG